MADLRDDGKKRATIKKKKVNHKPVTSFINLNSVYNRLKSR